MFKNIFSFFRKNEEVSQIEAPDKEERGVTTSHSVDDFEQACVNKEINCSVGDLSKLTPQKVNKYFKLRNIETNVVERVVFRKEIEASWSNLV